MIAIKRITKNPKFKVLFHVKILKYNNVFTIGYVPTWSEEIFVIKKVQNTVLWTYVISVCNGEVIAGKFYENKLLKTNQK